MLWSPPFPVDLPGVLSPHRRGRGDPTMQWDERKVAWLTANTAQGSGTLALCRQGHEIRAQAWGSGAESLLDGVPALLGAADDVTDFVAHHDVVAEAMRKMPALRLSATGRVWDALIPAILEQKVTCFEARRSWRELCWRFGEPAPGPKDLRVPPTPAAILSIKDWEWHKAGVDLSRRKALIYAAQVAGRLERAAELRGKQGRDLLCKVPGIGVWTAAEVAQRAWGDSDAVSFGDFHLAKTVGHILTGSPVDDAGLAELLAPYAPHRQRVVRYLESVTITRPRYGPRYSVRDYRAM